MSLPDLSVCFVVEEDVMRLCGWMALRGRRKWCKFVFPSVVDGWMSLNP